MPAGTVYPDVRRSGVRWLPWTLDDATAVECGTGDYPLKTLRNCPQNWFPNLSESPIGALGGAGVGSLAPPPIGPSSWRDSPPPVARIARCPAHPDFARTHRCSSSAGLASDSAGSHFRTRTDLSVPIRPKRDLEIPSGHLVPSIFMSTISCQRTGRE